MSGNTHTDAFNKDSEESEDKAFFGIIPCKNISIVRQKVNIPKMFIIYWSKCHKH